MDDLFDDWEMPTDDVWAEFDLPDADDDRREMLEKMGRRLRRLREDIREVDRAALAEIERIRSIARDRTHGAKRAEQWIEQVIADWHRDRLNADRSLRRSETLMCGVQVKASGTGGRPEIVDHGAYAKWATDRDLIDRDASVKVPWETVLLAVQALRLSVEEDVGGRSDGAPLLLRKLADVLDMCLEGQTVYRFPSYAEKGGEIRWNGEAWVDVHTGEVVPGLGRTEPGWNVVVVDQ